MDNIALILTYSSKYSVISSNINSP